MSSRRIATFIRCALIAWLALWSLNSHAQSPGEEPGPVAPPSSGTKQLYLRSDLGQALHRTPPTASQTPVSVRGGTQVWTLTPSLQRPLTLAAGTMPLRLLLTRIGGSGNSRTISVRLSNSALGTLAQASNVVLNGIHPNSPSPYTIALNLPARITAPAGSTFSLTITHVATPDVGFDVWPFASGDTSRLELNSLSVINIDSVQYYDAAHPGGTVRTAFIRGEKVYTRAIVSDPFGSFDVSGATVSVLAPDSSVVVNAAAMTAVADSGAATRVFEHEFIVPPDAATGDWTTRIVAYEGTERAVTHAGSKKLSIVSAALNVRKLSTIVADPVNLDVHPKRIPGSLQQYAITVTNTGHAVIDASTLVIADSLPADVELCVTTACGGVLSFVDGAPASGLGFDYASAVSYSSAISGGPPYSYSPSPGPEGYDGSIRGIRIAPSGAMHGASDAGSPNFTIRFFVRVR